MASRKPNSRLSRKRRIRAKVRGTSARPRMTVFRSLRQITAQIVDDTKGCTLVYGSTMELKSKPTMEGAKKLGEAMAKKAKEQKITAIVFDRNAYRYHGRVKALADAAREGGLTF